MTSSILVIEDSSRFSFGGGQKVTKLVVELLSNRFRIVLFDHTGDSLFVKEVRPYVYGLRRLAALRYCFAGTLLELLSAPFLCFLNALVIRQQLRKLGLPETETIVYATTSKSLVIAFFLFKLARLRYVFHAHLVFENRKFIRTLLHPALKDAETILCVSHAVFEGIRSPNCRVLYNPVRRLSSIPKRLNRSPIVVASFSSLIKNKGVEYFVRSHILLRDPQQVEYWVFGDGPERSRLESLKTEGVYFKGFVENMAPNLQNGIRIVVLPSIVNEALPMTVLEAFSAGIPVIATPSGGTKELITDGQNGFFVEAKDSRDIAEKIDRLAQDPELYSRMSSNALDSLARFNPERYNEEIMSVFNGLQP